MVKKAIGSKRKNAALRFGQLRNKALSGTKVEEVHAKSAYSTSTYHVKYYKTASWTRVYPQNPLVEIATHTWVLF